MGRTPLQVRHAAEVALHTKLIAVRLMTCDRRDQVELAQLFLDIFQGKSWDAIGDSCATREDGVDLLCLVTSGYSPAWAARFPFQTVPAQDFDLDSALDDCTKTSWAVRLCGLILDGSGAFAQLTAYRFLQLRETAVQFHPQAVTPALGAKLCQSILELCRPKKTRESRTLENPHTRHLSLV